MKRTGVTRPLDKLGRVVIPREICRELFLSTGTRMEFLMMDEGILINPINASCVFCGKKERLINYKGKQVCAGCIGEMHQNKGSRG